MSYPSGKQSPSPAVTAFTVPRNLFANIVQRAHTIGPERYQPGLAGWTDAGGRRRMPIGVGRAVAPRTRMTGGVSLGDIGVNAMRVNAAGGKRDSVVGGYGGALGVDAVAPQYLREFDATGNQNLKRSNPRVYRRARSARLDVGLGSTADGSGEQFLLESTADGSGEQTILEGSYYQEDADASRLGLGIAPAVALAAGKVIGSMIHGASPRFEGNGPLMSTVQLSLSKLRQGDLAELQSYGIIDSKYPKQWQDVFVQLVPAALVTDAQRALYNQIAAAQNLPLLSSAAPGAVTMPAVGPGTGSGASLISDVASGFFQTPGGAALLNQVGQGAVQAQVTRAQGALAQVPTVVWLTGLAALMFVAGRQRGRR